MPRSQVLGPSVSEGTQLQGQERGALGLAPCRPGSQRLCGANYPVAARMVGWALGTAQCPPILPVACPTLGEKNAQKFSCG